MATKKQDNAIKMVVGSFAGGAAAGVVTNLTGKIQFVADRPLIQKAIPAAVGVAAIYLGRGKMDSFGMGMLGASGANLSQQLMSSMQGFNRATYLPPDLDSEDELDEELIRDLEQSMNGSPTAEGGDEYADEYDEDLM